MGEGNRLFGRYLRGLRYARCLTLDDVSQRTRGEPGFISRTMLSQVENGSSSLTLERLVVLARVYGVSPQLLAERYEADYDLVQFDDGRTADWPVEKLFAEARRAGMSGRVLRAQFLYEEIELRYWEPDGGVDAAAWYRARLGAARAIHAGARYRLARYALEELLAEPGLPHDVQCWGNMLLCLVALDLDHEVLAEGALIQLERLEKPWPEEVEGTAPYLRARLMRRPETDQKVLEAWLAACDAAKKHKLVTIEAGILRRLARIQRLRGELGPARDLARRALEFAQDHDLGWHKARAWIELALVEHARGRKAAAREAWSRAKTIARALRLHEVLFMIHGERWRLAVAAGDERAARSELVSARRVLGFLGEVPAGYRDVEQVLRREDEERQRAGRGRSGKGRKEPE